MKLGRLGVGWKIYLLLLIDPNKKATFSIWCTQALIGDEIEEPIGGLSLALPGIVTGAGIFCGRPLGDIIRAEIGRQDLK